MRPSSTAPSIVAKLSSVSSMSAAWRATSVPPAPMAMPMSACLRAGASLTPSPVIATTSPLAWRACTSCNFWAGVTRANTSTRSTHSAMPSGPSSASWRPSIANSCSASAVGERPMPILRAMARAVSRWSPVIIFTVMPAAWQAATAWIASGRGGSNIPCRPRKSKSFSTWWCSNWCWEASAWPMAKASTRSPRAAITPTAASIAVRSRSSGWPRQFSCRLQRSRTASTEPFTKIRSLPCSVAMNCCSEAKGIASRRGWRSSAS